MALKPKGAVGSRPTLNTPDAGKGALKGTAIKSKPDFKRRIPRQFKYLPADQAREKSNSLFEFIFESLKSWPNSFQCSN
jgi:hypothetical protein